MRKHEVAVITGASAGVGRAAAREFARRGVHLGLIARHREALEATKTDIEAYGVKALVCEADVARSDQVEAAASAIERDLGPIDIWVNNAMVTIVSPIKQLQPDEVKQVTEVTYLGAVNGTLAALRRMLPRDRGTIVQVGSALSYRAIPLQAPYCGAKFAIRGFTDSLRSELLHDRSRIHVTMVQLPALNTPQFDWCKTRMPRKPRPVPPIFQPEIAARAIVWAARHRRRELFVGSSTVKAILANKIAPGLLDRVLGRKGYDAQQSDEPAGPDRIDNLWDTVRKGHDAHGRFDGEAKSNSSELWLTTHRAWMGAAALATLVLAHIASRSRR
ncbi:MAG: SDR family oxidoreductase [Betaproteobacteria bacterium]|nr:MAG: SDR family oxidoreductase [Betaproteobacteria bacterium]